jgi:hypothetical protein
LTPKIQMKETSDITRKISLVSLMEKYLYDKNEVLTMMI